MDTSGLAFPFHIDERGSVAVATGDENIRSKILQVLLTALGERVNLPDFGCGLRDLLFDPNNEILAAVTEFTVTKSLGRWLGDEILVERVDVTSDGEQAQIEVVYTRRDRLETGKVKIAF
jgi:phage baseplate assembly protein W